MGTWKVVSALEDVSTDDADVDSGGGGGGDTGTMVASDTLTGGVDIGLFGMGYGGMGK